MLRHNNGKEPDMKTAAITGRKRIFVLTALGAALISICATAAHAEWKKYIDDYGYDFYLDPAAVVRTKEGLKFSIRSQRSERNTVTELVNILDCSSGTYKNIIFREIKNGAVVSEDISKNPKFKPYTPNSVIAKFAREICIRTDFKDDDEVTQPSHKWSKLGNSKGVDIYYDADSVKTVSPGVKRVWTKQVASGNKESVDRGLNEINCNDNIFSVVEQYRDYSDGRTKKDTEYSSPQAIKVNSVPAKLKKLVCK